MHQGRTKVRPLYFDSLKNHTFISLNYILFNLLQ